MESKSSLPLTPAQEKRAHQMRSGLYFPLFSLAKMPLAWWTKLRIVELDGAHCTVRVPYGWRTKNPFRSTHFASLSLAAELSTGALAQLHLAAHSTSIAMLLVGLEGKFLRKATTPILFDCPDGESLAQIISQCADQSEGCIATVQSTGRNANGQSVAEFTFQWSFRRREK